MDVTEMTETLRSFLAADGPSRIQEHDFLARMREFETLARLTQAALLELATEAETRCLPVQYGCTSLSALVQDVLGISGYQAGERSRLARALPKLPATRKVLRNGEIDTKHVDIINSTLKGLPTDVTFEVREEAEATLAEQARTLDPSQLQKSATHLRTYLDPDGVLREEKDAVASRELVFGKDPQGRLTFKGRLDPEAGAAFRTALDGLSAPRPAEDGTRDSRSVARRQADALVEFLYQGLEAGYLPMNRGVRPHVGVLIDFVDLRDSTSTGDLDWDGILTAAAIRRIACDAEIIPIVLGSNGVPLDLGRATRTITPHLRRALRARDKGCAFPGCDRPPEWTEGHHVVHWAQGGPTDLGNLVSLCRHHHSVVHHDGWEVEFTEGIPEFIPPRWIDPDQVPRRNTRGAWQRMLPCPRNRYAVAGHSS